MSFRQRLTLWYAGIPTGQACSFGLTFGYQTTHSNYLARLSFLTSGAVELRVEKEVDDTVTQLATTLTLDTVCPRTTGRSGFAARAPGSGPRHGRAASAEPSAWAVDVSDSTFCQGPGGPARPGQQGLYEPAGRACPSAATRWTPRTGRPRPPYARRLGTGAARAVRRDLDGTA